LDIMRLRPALYKIAKKCGVYAGVAIYHPYRETEVKSWEFSPHFHVIGFGWVRFVAALYDKYGWIIKNLGLRKTVHGTILYQLSHAGVHEEHHVLTWFGKLAYNNFKVPELPETKPVCPLCDLELVNLIWFGGMDKPPPDSEGEYFMDPDIWRENSRSWRY
jgi:hypothetical protein